MKNILNNIDTLIFDMDGTLIDSMGIWRKIDEEFFANHNMPFPNDLLKNIDGFSFDETADYFLNTYKFPYTKDEIKNIWHNMSFEYYRDKIPYKTGALKFLKEMKKRGLKMGMATSNSRELTDAIDSRLHFSEYITEIVTNNEVPHGKPEPDIFLLAAKRLNSDPNNCLVFEDITGGILAGKRAGMKVCALHDEFSMMMDDDKRRLSDYYINDYFDILNLL